MPMAPAAGPRRLDKGKSKSKKRKEARRRTTVHDLPDHVFEQILLRLGPTSPFLVRAAATCKRWCRVVADAGFLARLASAGAPQVGEYRTVDECPIFVPSTPLDIDERRFSLDFLPDSESWKLADSRRSLLLLEKKCTCLGASHYRCGWRPDLVVCDPLTKRHQGILWPPDLDGLDRMGVFLADGAGRRVSMSNFRIIAAVDETVVLVFTTGSDDGGWHIVRSELPDDPETITAGFFTGRVNGSLYWRSAQEDSTMVLVLDEATAVFSLAYLPENVWGLSDEETARLIGGDDGVLRAVRLIGNDLNVFARRRPAGCSNDDDEWVLEKQLGLPEATAGLPGHDEALFEQEVTIITANDKYILISTSGEELVFSVELDTMRVEPETYTGEPYPYELPWPPVLPDVSTERRR